MTLVLGLTGGIASGKSTADRFFSRQGIPVIDSDQIAHDLLNVGQPSWQQVKKHFGKEFLNVDQTVNRKKLGELVFSDPKQLQVLNELTHPLIDRELAAEIKMQRQKRASLLIVDIPLLFEAGMSAQFDATLLITVPQSVQLARLMARNGLTKEEAQARIASQMPLSAKEELATYVVVNTGTIKELEAKLTQLLKQIKKEP
ncbi:dephospho-CoA kinase [Lactobacillus sp. ESL0791]|uniref:dephospho-CoA kinase n=1 Tax=Lactobacillus sp. ESL0791 TaxID=2983234 RepID=UPI0023F65353|nr:dephospho-CoA kinase [Lactobacillus sp. ESL0791]MDF7639183.1 dephospho-CoA kinase [Lactobacillus sp. ESL0791]